MDGKYTTLSGLILINDDDFYNYFNPSGLNDVTVNTPHEARVLNAGVLICQEYSEFNLLKSGVTIMI